MGKYTSTIDGVLDMIANDSPEFKHVPRIAGKVYRKYQDLVLREETYLFIFSL
jgi:hypothetical protein